MEDSIKVAMMLDRVNFIGLEGKVGVDLGFLNDLDS